MKLRYKGYEDGVALVGVDDIDGELAIPEIAEGRAVVRIERGALAGCRTLKSVSIPDSVRSIGEGAFSGCDNLSEVHISDIVSWCNIEFEDIGSNPIYFATFVYIGGELITELDIPSSVQRIAPLAFYGFFDLENVRIPEGVREIGARAFDMCLALVSVRLPDGIQRIERMCFSGCDNLSEVSIPLSVRCIDEEAFDSCFSLSDIYYLGSAEDWERVEIAEGNECLADATIHFAFGEKS